MMMAVVKIVTSRNMIASAEIEGSSVNRDILGTSVGTCPTSSVAKHRSLRISQYGC